MSKCYFRFLVGAIYASLLALGSWRSSCRSCAWWLSWSVAVAMTGGFDSRRTAGGSEGETERAWSAEA